MIYTIYHIVSHIIIHILNIAPRQITVPKTCGLLFLSFRYILAEYSILLLSAVCFGFPLILINSHQQPHNNYHIPMFCYYYSHDGPVQA